MINTYDIENTSTFNLNVLVSVCLYFSYLFICLLFKNTRNTTTQEITIRTVNAPNVTAAGWLLIKQHIYKPDYWQEDMHLLHTKLYNHLPPYYLLQLHFCKVYHYPYILLRPIQWSLFYILIIFYFFAHNPYISTRIC